MEVHTMTHPSLVARPRVWPKVFVMTLGVCMLLSPGLFAQSAVPKPVATVKFATPPAFDGRNIRSAQSCAEAARFVDDSVQQYWQTDTLYINEDRPTPPPVVEIARQCLIAFPIQTIDTLELPTILRIALYTGDTIPVKAVLDRMLVLQPGVRERAVVLMTVLGDVKSRMQPVSLPFLYSLLMRLDSLGPEASLEQTFVRRAIYDSYERRGAHPDSMLARAGEMLAALHIPVVKDARGAERGFADSVAYFQREVAWYTYLRDGTPGAFQTWRALVTRWQRGGLVGQPIPSIEGEFWIGRGTGADTVRPQTSMAGRSPFPGQVTVIVGGGAGDAKAKSSEWNLLRRIHDRFPEVKLVLLAQTTGAALGQIRLDDPAGEAAVLGQIYLDSLQLPIWINVSKTVIDTSRWNSNGQPLTFNSATYDSWRVPNQFSGIYVVNRQGYVVRRITRTFADPGQIFTMLERLLQLRDPVVASGE